MILKRRFRRPGSGTEHGFTLLEVMLTSALMLIVLAIVLPQVSGSITNFDNAQVRSAASDAAQLAMGQVSHDVQASNVLYLDPAGAIHLQVFNGNVGSSTTVTTTAPLSTCVEYQVSGGILQRRTKAPTSATWPTNWSTVMTGVVNSTQPGNPPVFAVSQNRSLAMTLWVNVDTRVVNAAKPSLFTTTVTGGAIPNNPSSTTGAC